MLRRIARVGTAALIAAAGAVALLAPAANAATPVQPQAALARSCEVIYSFSCNSGSVGADPSTHSISYYVAAPIGCGFRVRDTDNQNLVINGTIFYTPWAGGVNGLTDHYRIELYHCPPGSYASILGWK